MFAKGKQFLLLNVYTVKKANLNFLFIILTKVSVYFAILPAHELLIVNSITFIVLLNVDNLLDCERPLNKR